VPPIAMLQVTPSTRASMSSGTVRCSSVNPETSTKLFAAPMTASRIAIAAVHRSGAMSMIGTPQATSAQQNTGIYRTGGLYIAGILAARAVLFLGVYEGLRRVVHAVFGGSGVASAALTIAIVAVFTCAMGMLAARAMTRATLQVLKGERPTSWLAGVLAGLAGVISSGGLGLPGAIVWLRHRGKSTRFEPYAKPPEE
jgi:hypothetical protein